MAIISVGYDGAVTESQWSEMIKKIGSADYGVVGLNDWKVTPVTAADRTVSIAPGKGWGHGVFDENTAAVQIQLDTVSSGYRWDMIAMRRDWTGAGGVSTFVKVNGTSVSQIPVGRTSGPGVIDEQPIALVQVIAGQTAPGVIIDLRVWAGNGGMTMMHDLALGYINTVGAQVLDSGNGKKYSRRIAPDGNAVWEASAPDGYIPLYAFGSTLAGGIPATGGNFFVQAGTTVNTFDGGGYARITFPRAFPNGLLYIAGFNGDDHGTGGSMTFASAGGVWGAEGFGSKSSWVYVGRAQDASDDGAGSMIYNRTWCANRIHRINWLAIGW
jgi:hypothetical protein